MLRVLLRSGTKVLPLIAVAMMAGCGPAEERNATADANVAEPAPSLPSIPRPEPPIGREALLAAVAQAASATAAGLDDAAAQRSLDGRQFELRIRFGCRGPSEDLASKWLGWSYDAEDRSLRVRALPTISKQNAVVAKLGADAFEAVEGFWIPRPWLQQPVCPVAAAVVPAPPTAAPSSNEAPADQRKDQGAARTQASAGQDKAEQQDQERATSTVLPRVGIGQFFTDTDARTGRRSERAYEAVKTLPEGQPISSQGFDLVLSGRLRALPGSRKVIHCLSPGADAPPDCIISANFDRVWIESPGSREVLAEWERN